MMGCTVTLVSTVIIALTKVHEVTQFGKERAAVVIYTYATINEVMHLVRNSLRLLLLLINYRLISVTSLN